MIKKLFTEIMLAIVVLVVVVVGAVGSNIILIETNYVYAQWITPSKWNKPKHASKNLCGYINT
jgi:hypothetical protein